MNTPRINFNPEDPKWTAYVLGELDVTERAQVEETLDASPEARTLIEELRLASNLLKEELTSSAALAPLAMTQDQREAIHAAAQPAAPLPFVRPSLNGRRGIIHSKWGLVLTAAAGLALAISLPFVLDQEPAAVRNSVAVNSTAPPQTVTPASQPGPGMAPTANTGTTTQTVPPKAIPAPGSIAAAAVQSAISVQEFIQQVQGLSAGNAGAPSSVAAVTTGNSQLRGVVMDYTDAVLPAVKVTLQNTDTGVQITTLTNEVGIYQVNGLPAGNYKVTTSFPGFSTHLISTYPVRSSEAYTLDFKLQPGQIASVVDVTSQVNNRVLTDTPSVGHEFSGAELAALPMVTGNILELLSVLPGYREYQGGCNSIGAGGSCESFDTVGALGLNSVNATLNGISINNPRTSAESSLYVQNSALANQNTDGFGRQMLSSTNLNPELVGEVRLQLAPTDAEAGRANSRVAAPNGSVGPPNVALGQRANAERSERARVDGGTGAGAAGPGGAARGGAGGAGGGARGGGAGGRGQAAGQGQGQLSAAVLPPTAGPGAGGGIGTGRGAGVGPGVVGGVLGGTAAVESASRRAPQPPPPPPAPMTPPPALADRLVQPTPNTESYNQIIDNPFIPTGLQNLATFSIDVDTASYANVRRFLTQNQLPPRDAVRIEELLNYFPYDYAKPTGSDPIAPNLEVAAAPWNPQHRLVRVGIKARELEGNRRPPSNLVFLIDVSGSMNSPEKLPLVKAGLQMLVENLGENDMVSIVVYAGASGLVLPPTSGMRKDSILAAINNLQPGGSTNGASGIQLAYNQAVSSFIRGGANRVVLMTDGDFNVGITNQSDLTRLIEERAKSGVFLTVLGFGMGNIKDSTLERLADQGNGHYAYIDNYSEARKVLVEEVGGTLVAVAKDVKIQVDFNPGQVEAYRLIGYENRILRTQDFNNDLKDAGDMGAGHTVTALFEIVPRGGSIPGPSVDASKYTQPANAQVEAQNNRGRGGAGGGGAAARAADNSVSNEMLTLRVRYKLPDADTSTRKDYPLVDRGAAFSRASQDFRFAASVAEFGMILRQSPYRGNSSLEAVMDIAEGSRGQDRNGYRQEFISLVQRARAFFR